MASITEKRFREASGVQYLGDGRIRCQGLSKGQIRKYRQEHNDFLTPKEDLWPECQCVKAAEEGAFACKFHGGRTPKGDGSPRTMLDVMPVDLADKFRTIVDNPMYISRRDDIALLQARIWHLLEEMSLQIGSEDAWGAVHEALLELRKGNEMEALTLLEEATTAHKEERDNWEEILKTEQHLKDLTNTQMRTAKELRLMASAEQVSALIMNIQQTILYNVKEYIDDPKKQQLFLQSISAAIGRFANFGNTGSVAQLVAGSYAEDADAE